MPAREASLTRANIKQLGISMQRTKNQIYENYFLKLASQSI